MPAAPGIRVSPPGAFCQANITWNSGLWARLLNRLHDLHHLFKRDVLMLLRRQHLSFHLSQQLFATLAVPIDPTAAPACSRIIRSALRSSLRLRLATGVPITTSFLTRQPPQQRCPCRQTVMYRRRPVPAGSVLLDLRVSFRFNSTRTQPPAMSCSQRPCMIFRDLQQPSVLPPFSLFQYSSCCRNTSPSIHCRCHTA